MRKYPTKEITEAQKKFNFASKFPKWSIFSRPEFRIFEENFPTD